MYILNKVHSLTWLCEPKYLKDEIERIAATSKEFRVNSLEDLKALETELGKPLKNTYDVQMRGSTAIIPVHGSIIRYGNIFSRVSGTTSVDILAKDFATALADPKVKSIMLDIDSPGGEAKGINEFAEMIYASRGTKPIKAYVSGSAQSAAYWIASACDEIIADDTAALGSIGVAMFIDDDSEAKAGSGVKEIKFKSTLSPNKLPDFTTEEGQKLIQDNIDRIADVFFTKVARNRSSDNKELTSEDVVNRFKQGGTAIGSEAVEIGLADRLGSYESLIRELSKEKVMKRGNPADLIESANEEGTELVAGELVARTATNVVSEEKFNALQEQLNAIMEAKKESDQKAEALAAELTEASKIAKESAEKLLAVEAENVALSFGNKLIPAQKEVFKELYKFVSSSDPTKVEMLTKLVNLQSGVEVLSEEVLASDDLNELPNIEPDEDELAGIDSLVKSYAARENAKGAK